MIRRDCSCFLDLRGPGDETIGTIESGIGVSALMIIQNCSAICKTNPSVIVQPYESGSVGQPERFGVGCCACAMSAEAHR